MLLDRSFIVGPTGGLVYHASAVRFRRSRWRPFIAAVNWWLDDIWNPANPELIIFGSSAGWTLNERFLGGFERVTCVEPDPLARFLFRRRFRGIKDLEFAGNAGILPWHSTREESFADFLATRPNAAILFANLLGQIHLLPTPKGTEPSVAKKQEAFHTALKTRVWASYHDIFSAKSPVLEDTPRFIAPETATTLASKPGHLAGFAERIYPARAKLVDHETLWLSNGRETHCAIWEIRPKVHHFIGFVHTK